MERNNVGIYAGVGATLLSLPLILSYISSRRKKRIQKEITRVLERKKEIYNRPLENVKQVKNFEKISNMTASQLVECLQSGQLTSEEVTTHFIQVAKHAHNKYNCLTDSLFNEALEQARNLDEIYRTTGKTVGPLHGLPISIKDNIGVKDTDCTLGALKYCNKPRELDSVLVATLREKGAVIFCKTNVPETLLLSETYNSVFGATLNPFDKERTCGGSSGGEGTLIASGGSPLGFGTDIGGSIRIPANFCGLVGFKPTAGRISHVGTETVVKGQEAILSTTGPLGLSVDDVAMILNVIMDESMWGKDPRVAPVPFNIDVYKSSTPLRIGYYVNDLFFTPHYASVRAVNKAVEALKNLGHTLIPINPPHVDQIVSLYISFITSDGMRQIADYLKGEISGPTTRRTTAICNLPSFLKRTIAFLLRLFGQNRLALQLGSMGPHSSLTIAQLVEKRKKLTGEFIGTMQDLKLDAILSPASGTVPFHHGLSNRISSSCSYTMIQNLFNLPGGVVPVCFTKESDWKEHNRENKDLIDKIASASEKGGTSLPVGVQVYSMPWKDEVVLRVMKDIESAIKYEKSLRMRKFVVRAAYGDVGTLLHAIPMSDVDIDDEPLF